MTCAWEPLGKRSGSQILPGVEEIMNFFTPPRKFQDLNSIFFCSTPLHPWELMPTLLKYSETIHWQKASGFPRFGVDPS